MDPLRRRLVFGLGAIGVVAGCAPVRPFTTSLSPRLSSPPVENFQNDQTGWVLGALAREHGGRVRIPPAVIVDKVQGKARAFLAGEEIFSVNLLVGRSRKDTVISDRGLSIFDQEVTPAGSFSKVEVIYDPTLSGGYYKKALISFMDVQVIENSREILAFHSVLGVQNDFANVRDGDPANNNLSNGCIRMSREDTDRMLAFFLGERLGIFESAIGRGAPYYLSSPVRVLILPEEDTSRDNTLRRTGFADSLAHVDPSLISSVQPA